MFPIFAQNIDCGHTLEQKYEKFVPLLSLVVLYKYGVQLYINARDVNLIGVLSC